MNASINAFHLSQKTAISYNECIQAIDVDSDHDTNIFSTIDLLFAFSHQNQIGPKCKSFNKKSFDICHPFNDV
jgi:hypothetical protein